MACYWPRPGWRLENGAFTLREPGQGAAVSRFYRIPCGGCIGCRIRLARDWAIRCQLELSGHTAAAWVTLTYDEKYLPPTLSKSHVATYLKRLRSRLTGTKIKHFACGEYGEQNGRPHYHAILYGIPPDSRHLESAWRMGFVHSTHVSPANIAYTAGYAQKKLTAPPHIPPLEQVDPDTGECFTYVRPFRLCSRRPGIGADARRYSDSWRSSAIHQGRPVPVPRYLHESWRGRASLTDLEDLDLERLRKAQPLAADERLAGERIANARHQHDSLKRRV